jgi:hypothetical protein
LLRTIARKESEEAVRYLLASFPALGYQPDSIAVLPVMQTAIYDLIECFRCFLKADLVSERACDLTKWTILYYTAHCGAQRVLEAALEANFVARYRYWPTVDLPTDCPAMTPLRIACHGATSPVRGFLWRLASMPITAQTEPEAPG